MFNHLNIKIKEIAVEVKDSPPGQRLYRTPSGLVYPSITTVLSILSKDAIEDWKNRIGKKAANFESTWATDRGTALHELIEDFLQNKKSRLNPNLMAAMLFQDLKPYLLKINSIHIQECSLYSDKFKIAGRCDCIAEYGGKLSIIDFKGSKKPKRASWIENYFMQCAFYAFAYYERTGIKIPQCVVLVACESGRSQEFIFSPKDWLEPLMDLRKEYRKQYDI